MPARTTAATATSSSRPPADPAAAPGGWDTWSRRLQNLGRWGVFAIPVYALFAGLTQRDEDAYSTDPAIYAHYRRHVRFAPWELIVTYGLGLLCVVSLVALTALLIRGRGRIHAVVGLGLGLAGSAALLATVGSVIVRSDQVRSAFFGGHWSKIAINAAAHGSSVGFLVAGGAIALTVGWMLLGVAVWRTPGLNRADGPLLIVSAPLLYLGGMAMRTLPTMGSFLLLAAGLGIAAQAKRSILAGDVPLPVPLVTRSRSYSRLVGEDVYASSDDLEEFERDFDGTAGPTPVNGAGAVSAANGAANGASAEGGSSDGGWAGGVGAAAAVGGPAVGGATVGKGAAPRHADRGLIGHVKSTRGMSIAWPVTRRRRDDASHPAVKAETSHPESTKAGAKTPTSDQATSSTDATSTPATGAAGTAATAIGTAEIAATATATADATSSGEPRTRADADSTDRADITPPPVAEKPKSGLLAALTAIFNSTMTLGRKIEEPAPIATSTVAGRPAAQFGLPRPDGTKITPPVVSTSPAGRATTPSLANRMPGVPTPATAKATNATNGAKDSKRGARKANAKGGKGKPGKG